MEIAGYSINALMLAGAALVPVYFGMQRAYGQASGDPKSVETYHAILDIINNMLANITPTIVEGLPNVGIGMLGLIFLLMYFI